MEEIYLDAEEMIFKSEGYEKKPMMECSKQMGNDRCNGPEAQIIKKERRGAWEGQLVGHLALGFG